MSKSAVPSRPAVAFGLRVLRRLRLVVPAFRAYERWLARPGAGRDEPAVAADGLPLPPPELRVLVAGHPRVRAFLEKGELAARTIDDALARHGATLSDSRALLDFGCGCGRVTRHWHRLERTDVHGCDVNPRLVAWVDAHLPFVTARTTAISPPLPYADGAFDVVHALSVFTHLPAELQRPWADELRRVLAPGGHLLLSTHGAAFLDRLTEAERAAFAAGELVVHFAEAPGSNLCSAFHPEDWVRDRLLPGFDVLEVAAGGARGNGRQDLVVARRH